MILRPVVFEVMRDMKENPTDWVPRGEYCIERKSDGLELWVANKPFAYGLYKPHEIWFGLLGSFIFQVFYSKWLNAKAASLIERNGNEHRRSQ